MEERRIRLREILDDLRIMEVQGDVEGFVNGVSYDSRDVKDGFVFVALRGERYDGHMFIQDAVKMGASAVLVERLTRDINIAQVVVTDTREALGRISDAFYNHPSHDLTIVGITGTNGKTTTTYILESMLQCAGFNTGVMGTIDYRYAGNIVQASHTTPEAPETHKLLRDMVGSGVTHCVMEVSSHALAQKRVDGVKMKVGVFTNLTQDHLDYHETMAMYFASKARLFKEVLDKEGTAVINIDDPWGKRLADDLTDTTVIRCSLKNELAEIRPTRVDMFENGLDVNLVTPIGDIKVLSSLVGEYNLMNIMVSIGVGVALKLDKASIVKGIQLMKKVPGRMELVSSAIEFKAFVDYAHTPDALERVLITLKGFTKGKVITVFGCGGERDQEKRSLMGAISAEWSDISILTSDNPRGEDPIGIIKDIESGMGRVGRFELDQGICDGGYVVISDRRKAIEVAVGFASSGDTVVVAGKGHEDYQLIEEERRPFNDVEELNKAIKNKEKRTVSCTV